MEWKRLVAGVPVFLVAWHFVGVPFHEYLHCAIDQVDGGIEPEVFNITGNMRHEDGPWKGFTLENVTVWGSPSDYKGECYVRHYPVKVGYPIGGDPVASAAVDNPWWAHWVIYPLQVAVCLLLTRGVVHGNRNGSARREHD